MLNCSVYSLCLPGRTRFSVKVKVRVRDIFWLGVRLTVKIMVRVKVAVRNIC